MKNNLKKTMVESGVHRALLSRMTGIRKGTLYKLENELQFPKLVHGYLISKALEKDIRRIFPDPTKKISDDLEFTSLEEEHY